MKAALLFCICVLAISCQKDKNSIIPNQVGEWRGIKSCRSFGAPSFVDTVEFILTEDRTGQYQEGTINNWRISENQNGAKLLIMEYVPNSGWGSICDWPTTMRIVVDQPNYQEWTSGPFPSSAIRFELERK